ncbi:uncharacterized protein LOC114853070 isoform X2 [Betta splendens]|uniref:Uncharacterized protein LOC114853070 isoform X2 n=1 Tax=Betta splendens TaxID=158456 RepID=A0A6P7M6L2_BETSP|nr:uncharacterized protein LOC114853070 isoform X2 [Betta splendens]
MAPAVKTLVPARPVKSVLSTNILFLDGNNPDDFSTCFQEDFQHFSCKKVKPFCPSFPARVDHKDVRHINEKLTEAMDSYRHHPLPMMTRVPRWAMLHTNIKMEADPTEAGFLTTQSQAFCPKPSQPPTTRFRPSQSFKVQQVEPLPESTNKSSFPPHQSSAVVKVAAKHLEALSTIKGDNHYCTFVSQYNDTFQGAWSRATQPVAKHFSSVSLGDPVKIVDRESTYTTSFSRPTVCRYKPPLVKEHFKLSLGNFSETSWSSTSKETFIYHKPDPVAVTRRNPNFSSLPKGDIDPSHNRERMSVTTNKVSFSDLNHKEHPVFAPGPSLMTKSHVNLSSPRLSGLYYTTTAKEHYSKKGGERATPATQLPSNILSGPEHEPSLSTTKADFVPLKTCKGKPLLLQRKSNVRFPLVEQEFSTTHGEHYKAKPLLPTPQ